ncbi:hypothetical protein Tco_0714265 [Tanacetum coccineum]
MGIRIPHFDVPTSVADEAIIKEMHDGLVRAITTASSLEADQGSGNIAKTQTKATSSRPSSPRTSSEGGPRCHFTMGDIPVQARPKRVSKLPNEPPLGEDNVTLLKDELASTKAIYNKALITLTKRGRMIKEIDEDETINLDKSRELGKSHDIAKHRTESKHEDDDRTLAETLLNIKRSAAKGKAIMQESEPPKKIKKKEMIQISLDEEFAKSFYEEEQAQILQDEIYAKQVEAQWIADEERIPQEAKQTDEREKVINWNDPDVLRYHAVQNRPFSKAKVRKNMCTYLKNQGGYKMSHFKGMSYEDIRPIFERVWDQNQAFVSKDSEIEKEVMKRPGFDLQQESSKKAGGSRKKTLARKRAGEKQSKEGAKRQKTEYEKEKEELRLSLKITTNDDSEVYYEPLSRKYPIVSWEYQLLGKTGDKDMEVYKLTRADGSSSYHGDIQAFLRRLDRQDLNDLYSLVQERFQTTSLEGHDLLLWGDLKMMFDPDESNELWMNQLDWKLMKWKLHENCGVHTLFMWGTPMEINMLVEKKYPLTKEILKKMLRLQLEAEEESTMAFELIKFIKSLLEE